MGLSGLRLTVTDLFQISLSSSCLQRSSLLTIACNPIRASVALAGPENAPFGVPVSVCDAINVLPLAEVLLEMVNEATGCQCVPPVC